MILNLTPDALLADNTETVTITLRRSTDTVLAGIEHCLRAPLVKASRQWAGVELQGNEIVWSVPVSGLGGQQLKPGDEITDGDEVVFVILSCRKLTFGTRWSCACRQQG